MLIQRKGLTLIEVLIIIVMFGILLTIVIQKLGGKKNKELISALQTDVRNAQTAENKYFAVHNSYGTLAQLDSARLFNPVPANTVTITVTPTGYVAAATNSADPMACTLTVTTGAAGAAASADPVCQ